MYIYILLVFPEEGHGLKVEMLCACPGLISLQNQAGLLAPFYL